MSAPQPLPCDLCGSTAQRLLFDHDREGDELCNVICQRCGLVFVSPRESDEVAQEQYHSGDFSARARGALAPSQEKIALSEATALRRYRQIHAEQPTWVGAGGRLLEVGCGLGSFLRLMQGAGWQVAGLEPDPTYAAAGTALYGVPIKAKLFEEVREEAESLDAIAAFHVLEHVLSPRSFLQRAHTLLRPGGLLLLEVPCIERPYSGNLAHFFWKSHLYSFSQPTLRGLLDQAGFTTLSADYYHDFLCISAQRRAAAPPTPLALPLDDPAARWAATQRSQAQFQARQRNPLLRLIHRAALGARRAIRLAREEPTELPAGLHRVAQRARLRGAQLPPVRRRQAPYLAHFGMHVARNAGDTLLFVATRQTVGQALGGAWQLEPLWDEVTPATVQRLNQEARAVVVGGGGLLLRDTNPNANSGWQWNIPTARIREIKPPIVVFAIGYNRFRQQDDFDAQFDENIEALVRHSAFFGLRNHGSLRALAEHLSPEAAARLRWQPCPTTLLRLLDARSAEPPPPTTKRAALNVAFDRHTLRFAGREDAILTALARAMRWLTEAGWQLDLVLHRRDDAMVIPWLHRARVPFREVLLDGHPARAVMDYYRTVPLTIGMRGHSQMIPFGLGNPILSLVSHDKLSYFLEDIGHPEWGIDVGVAQFEAQLVARLGAMIPMLPTLQQQIFQAQARLWQVTQDNLALILDHVGGAAPQTPPRSRQNP